MGRIDYETETLIAHALRGEGHDASEDGTGRGTPIIAIQGAATRENTSSGPDGVGVRDDGAAYTIETRAEVRAVAFPERMSATQAAATLDVAPSMQSLNPTAVAYDSTQITSAGNFSSPKDGDPCHPLSAGAQAPIFTLAIRGRGDGHDLEYRDDGTSNAILTPNGGRAGIGVGAIATSWSVRRLTPTECERLQGFPDGWTDIPHKGKPAADGPRYKALGNSMAVNVMRWIGQRIQQVEAIPWGIIYLTPEMG